MALNCSTCTKKPQSMAYGHCTEFDHIPQVDACAMHTSGIEASRIKEPVSTTTSGSYIWLNEVRQPQQLPVNPV